MLLVTATFTLDPEKIDEALRAMVIMSQCSEAEPGCSRYRFGRDLLDENIVHLTEVWEDEASLKAHFVTPHSSAFSSVLRECLLALPEATRYDVSSSGPLTA
jgi:quinol monooxygenase YgiN